MLTSKSRENFEERIQEIKLLQTLSTPTPTLKENEDERKKSNSINRACLVLLCGHVEGYLEDRLIEFLDTLKENIVDCKRIPPIIKVKLCKQDLAMLENKDTNVLIERIPIFIEKYREIWLSDGVMKPDNFPIINYDDWEIGNPGSTKLEQALKGIGIDDIWEKINSREENRFLKGDLDGLVNRRNSIAHGHLESSATSNDVRKYIDTMTQLINQIDKIISKHQHDITSSSLSVKS